MFRDPWVLPLDMRDGARTARTKFGNLFAGNSDHLSTVAAFKAFKQLHGAARRHFCEENFLSPGKLQLKGIPTSLHIFRCYGCQDFAILGTGLNCVLATLLTI